MASPSSNDQQKASTSQEAAEERAPAEEAAAEGENLSVLQAGEIFDILEFELDEEFFSHRFLTLDLFKTFMNTLYDLLTCAELNRKKDLRLFKLTIKKVAQALIEIRPSWKAKVEQCVAEFHEEIAKREPVRLLNTFKTATK